LLQVIQFNAVDRFTFLPTVEDVAQRIGQNQEAASELSNMAADLQKIVGQFNYS
jgi:hypothetical protein